MKRSVTRLHGGSLGFAEVIAIKVCLSLNDAITYTLTHEHTLTCTSEKKEEKGRFRFGDTQMVKLAPCLLTYFTTYAVDRYFGRLSFLSSFSVMTF